MVALEQEAAAANVLTDYLAKRDIPALTADALQMQYGIAAVDVLILFGGAIPFGCDVAARACQAGLANKLLLVGGVGHTTRALQKAFAKRFPKMLTEGRAEAELMAEYLFCSYGIQDCSIEKKSTNCGNNVTYALAKLREIGCAAKTLLILQDASMQRRMDATFREVLEPGEKTVINYAPYRPEILVRDGNLVFRQRYWGLWNMERYLTLLMGEIPRLRDDENGYGPKGKKFLAHVDIPEAVEIAFKVLRKSGHGTVRVADEIYKS